MNEKPQQLDDKDARKPNEQDRHRFRYIENAEAFGPQPTPTSELPDPTQFATKLVGGIIECVHGLREPLQFTRHVNEDVYKALSAHAHRLHEKDQHLGKAGARTRPRFTMGNVVINNPRDGVVEASVIVHGPTRVRAVALRLEGLDHRWQATSFSML